MKTIKNLMPLIIFSMLLVANENSYKVQEEIIIYSEAEERPVIFENSTNQIMRIREEIDLFVEDFESNSEGWGIGSGWNLTTDDSNSPTHSVVSPNNVTTNNGLWDLVSPTYSLPALGQGETMNFDFYIKGDTPDTDGNGDNYLDDYYFVSILDLDALVWHASPTGSLDGNSYWCGQEELSSGNGGYLSEWLQFLDTPSFIVPNGGTLAADMKWVLESASGAAVAGTCVDGWDSANVRISNDNGLTWSLLTSTAVPYDFDCGNGWIYHDLEYDTGGSLHHLAPGWGNERDWGNISFDISEYAGQEVIVRFAFGSDGGWCTLDDPNATGFQVDNIVVSGELDCSPETECAVVASGEVWVDMFYDYCDADRPGYQAWEHYVPGMPFNGNVFMDISDFADKDVVFRFQTRYDADDDGGMGEGLFIDDFRIYKVSGGSFPPPFNLIGESLDQSVELSWSDLNASGTEDFQYDNDSFNNGITVTGGSAWAGERIDLAGSSTINSISVFNNNLSDTTLTVSVFDQFGSLFGNDSAYSTTIDAISGVWTTVEVNWTMTNAYIIAHEFNGSFSAALDESAGGIGHSMVMLNAGWDNWSEIASSNSLADGEWGIRANITYDGAGATYNVYQDGFMVQSGVMDNISTVSGLANNQTYSFSVSASYNDGADESIQSNVIELTPQAQTVHEEAHDDGSAEDWFNAGSQQWTAVRYSASDEGEDVVRFKWLQEGSGGAFYIKFYEDNNGEPGVETYSQVVAGGIVEGWNISDLSNEGLSVSGDFWIGTKEFSSTMPFGLDTSSDTGNSMSTIAGIWGPVAGNLMIRVYLDCGMNCDDSPSQCTGGDINADGIINVLDIVSAVNFVMNVATPTDDEACAADYNGDGVINVLDIVSIVNLILS